MDVVEVVALMDNILNRVGQVFHCFLLMEVGRAIKEGTWDVWRQGKDRNGDEANLRFQLS